MFAFLVIRCLQFSFALVYILVNNVRLSLLSSDAVPAVPQ